MAATDSDRDLAAAVHEALAAARMTVGCAESLTGGQVAALLSATPGASGTFRGGVVAYATDVKRSVLGVHAPQVVSPECAEELAGAARELLGSDWAVSTTGVAGPEEQEGRPVGTVYVGLAGPTAGTTSHELRLTGSREAIRAAAARAALGLLMEALAVAATEGGAGA